MVFDAPKFLLTVVSYSVTSTVFIILLFFVICKGKKLDYWEKQGVRGPKPVPIFVNILENIFCSYLTVTNKRYKKFGKMFGLYEASNPVLSLADPELLRHILVKDSEVFLNKRKDVFSGEIIRNMLISLRDEKWKKTRAIMSPTFTSGKIKKMVTIINGCVKSLMENIESKVNENEEIDLKAVYGAYAMDVIASCAFATKTNAHKNPNDPFVANAKEFFNFKIWRFLFCVMLPKFLRNFLHFNAFVSSDVINFFKATAKAIINERRINNITGNDFLQLLLDSEKSHNLMNTVKDINAEQFNKQNQEELDKSTELLVTENTEMKLTEDEVLAQCLLFFIAGYETTASLLSYATYALTVNPDCQELLYEEIKHYCDLNGEINYDSINKLKYLNAVINETLRLYPPFLRIEREASKNYTLPNTNITIPKGALIYIPIYDIHYDADNFAHPTAFKPERFLPENIDEIKPYTFLPFGAGPRNCIGMRFALMEAKLALCNLILNYRFVKSENTDVPLKMKFSVIGVFPAERVKARCVARY